MLRGDDHEGLIIEGEETDSDGFSTCGGDDGKGVERGVSEGVVAKGVQEEPDKGS